MVKQSNYQCECGFWYHDNGICKCGKLIIVEPEFYIGKKINFDPTKRPPRGAGWNKKQHKVIWK
jgi:hypothetical protein